ncbi:MAG: radical SAM protein [Kofleriaceae bacterium]
MDRAARPHRTARVELDAGLGLARRFAARAAAAPVGVDAARVSLAAALDGGAGALTLAAAAPWQRADLPALLATAVARGGEVTVECAAAGLDAVMIALWAAAGVTRLRVVHGGMRERVHDAVMGAPGTWRAAARGLATALTGPLPVELVVPVLRWNLDDVVPLVDWVAALPGRLERLALVRLRPADVPAAATRLLVDDPTVGALAAAAFDRCRAARIAAGFDGADAIIPCAAPPALDRFATVLHDGLRRQAADRAVRRVRVAACAACAVADACRGVDDGYHAAFGERGLAPISAARASAWRLRPARGGGEVDYAQISPFANRGAGAGRTLLRINGHCQMACAFCFVDRGVGDLPVAEVTAELDRLAARHTDHVVFSGGEPTLHPGLPTLVAHARARGFATVEIQTNGVRCDDPAYVDALVTAGLTKATVSLHSMDPATSDAITRMPGGFHRTVAGLHNLAARGVETQLAHVISRDNYAALPAFTQAMLAEFAGPGRHLSVCFAIAQAISDLVPRWVLPTFTEIKPFVRAALDACDAAGVGYGGLIGQGGYPPCMLDGELGYYRGVLDKIYASADSDAQFAKAPQCARCGFDRHCLGVRRDYLARHGDRELVPIAVDPAALGGATARPAAPPVDRSLVPLGRRSR